MDALQEIVLPFYAKALTVNTETTPAQVFEQCLALNFESVSSQGTKTREALTGQLGFFWQLIPDLKWGVQEMLTSGNRVIVRSIASGSPKWNFFGIECDGTKSFSIDTIDIHTVEDGKITRIYHVEDWASALSQLKQ